jgi:hypothetical protein
VTAQRVAVRETGEAGTVLGIHGEHYLVLIDGEGTPCGWERTELVTLSPDTLPEPLPRGSRDPSCDPGNLTP